MSRSEIFADIERIVSALPEERRSALVTAIGAPLSEGTYVSVDVPQECVTLTGLIIEGTKDDDGWDLGEDFVILADDGERYKIFGEAYDVTEFRRP